MRVIRTALALTLTLAASAARAQTATFKGRTLTESPDRPISGVAINVAQGKWTATTDSAGTFTINGITPGTYVVTARKVGFGAVTARLLFEAGKPTEADLVMEQRSQPLPDVKVEAKARLTAKMAEFEDHRKAGFGHFLTQADFEKHSFGLTADILRQLPALQILRDSRGGSAEYVTGGRLQTANGDPNSAGKCFAAVVLDGVFVYQGNQGEQPYNINLLGPDVIAGVEYYASSTTMPQKYNAPRPGACGLLVVWTK